MIRKITDKEILTSVEAREKYEKNYIGMVITEQKLHDPDNSRGYVLFVMDEYEEQFQIPRWLDDNTFVTTMTGMAVGGLEIGGWVFNDYDD